MQPAEGVAGRFVMQGLGRSGLDPRRCERRERGKAAEADLWARRQPPGGDPNIEPLGEHLAERLAGQGVVIPRRFMVEGEADAKILIPLGYCDVRIPTLTAEIREKSNTLNVKRSDAEAPPAPPKEPAKGRGRRGMQGTR